MKRIFPTFCNLACAILFLADATCLYSRCIDTETGNKKDAGTVLQNNNQRDASLHPSSTVVKILTDRLGNKIGSIEIRPDGIQIGRDRLGNKVGEYDPKRDVTRDRLGNKFGGGNLLAFLIVQAKSGDENIHK